jgi:hypothetical protein
VKRFAVVRVEGRERRRRLDLRSRIGERARDAGDLSLWSARALFVEFLGAAAPPDRVPASCVQLLAAKRVPSSRSSAPRRAPERVAGAVATGCAAHPAQAMPHDPRRACRESGASRS